ncbi:MAG: hypothetical protein K2K54_09755, partial [Lachnospiraceae bacterium]|nr:hypothetical protein [Lachnospiraceae bacterium]
VSTTAVAAVKYLSKEEIVSEIGNGDVGEAINGDEALELNETLEAGDYRFKLYTAATKEVLTKSGLGDGMSDEGGTYVILAVERLDGNPMPDTSSDEYGNIQFFVSPLIQGLAPWQYNMASMGGSHSTAVKDGVLYRIIECDDVALFADRRIYLCITDTTFYPAEAYNYNETDGTITRNEAYEGINLLIDLPLDKKRADEAKALAYLQKLEESWNAEPEEPMAGEEGFILTECVPLDDVIRKEHAKDSGITSWQEIPIETLLSYAVLEEASVQEVAMDDEGRIDYTYFFETGGGVSGKGFLSEAFIAGDTNVCVVACAYGIESAEFEVCRREADGTIKCMMYVLK